MADTPKRPTRIALHAPGTRRILIEMCRRVGANRYTLDLSNDTWYHTHTWTVEQQDAFVDWLTDLFMNDAEVRNELLSAPSLARTRARARKAAEEFAWQYGWKLAYTDTGGHA
ncbi:MAG: hypothetical protein GY851_21775 [bacterium]|nr:hypothetical protein [bacterium]